MDFEHAAIRFAKIAEGIDIGVNKITQRAATEALYYLAYYTPVDVATARSNWIVTKDASSTKTRPAFHPYRSRWKPRKGLYPGGTRGETSNLNAVLRRHNTTIISRKPDQDIYITNNLPYIIPLNEGHSKQIGRGWVRRAVAEAHRAAASDASRILRRELR